MGMGFRWSRGARRRFGSRCTLAVLATALNIALLYVLIKWISVIRLLPAPPTVKPIVVTSLIFRAPRPRYEPHRSIANPRLASVILRSLGTPPRLNIVIPIPLIPPREHSEIPASYSLGIKASPRGAAAGEAPTTVLVSGEQPGPALWKVTSVASSQHVLWILGEPPTPLPSKAVWRSKQAEAVLAQTQELILDGLVIFDQRVHSKPLPPLPENMQTLPWSQNLREVVPEDLYRRSELLKDAFAPKDHEFERLRPWAAGDDLREHVVKSLGLTNMAVSSTVLRLAWRAKVISVVTYPDYAVFVRNAFSVRPVTCLEKTVSELEMDRGDDLKRLANAWSIGDVKELRELLLRQGPDECLPALFDSAQQESEVLAQHTEQWLTAVELALKTRQTSFALAPMIKLLGSNGWLTELHARGYRVQGPPW